MWWLRVDFGIWALLVIVWAAAAPFSRRSVERESIGSRLGYLLPAVLAGLIVAEPRLRLGVLDRMVWSGSAVAPVSIGLTALGVGFALWARATLGRLWSGTITFKEGHELVSRGPYAITRHPIYTGMLVAFIGTAVGLGTGRALVGVTFLTAALVAKLRREERLLTEHFGETYANYRKRVRALIPFVW